MVWIVSLRNKYSILVRLIFLESLISFHREVENAPLRGIYYFMEKWMVRIVSLRNKYSMYWRLWWYGLFRLETNTPLLVIVMVRIVSPRNKYSIWFLGLLEIQSVSWYFIQCHREIKYQMNDHDWILDFTEV